MYGIRIRTNDLIQAAKELARDHNTQYAENCVRAALREKMISVDQYCDAMKVLYGD